MGISILLIMFLHTQILVPVKLRNLVAISYGGVDIFLFASGLGCVFSYKRSGSLFTYIKRRFERIFPTYWVFMLFWIPCFFLQDTMPLRSIIGNILGIEYLTLSKYSFNWYISFILVMYVVSPVLIEFMGRIKRYYQFFLAVIVLICLSVPFINSTNYIIMASRIPIFGIGVFFALFYEQDEEVGKKLIAVMMAAFVAGFIILRYLFLNYYTYLWNYGLFWYPFILIVPGACFIVSWISRLFSKNKILGSVIALLSKIGDLSFELFMIHIFFFDMYRRTFEHRSNIGMLFVYFLCFPASMLLKKAGRFVSAKLQSKNS